MVQLCCFSSSMEGVRILDDIIEDTLLILNSKVCLFEAVELGGTGPTACLLVGGQPVPAVVHLFFERPQDLADLLIECGQLLLGRHGRRGMEQQGLRRGGESRGTAGQLWREL